MVISSDGRFLYAASSGSGITGFSIGGSGALTQLEGSGGLAGCVHPTGADNCDDGKGMSPGSSNLALSPTGGLLYAASSGGKSLAVIIRNTQNGLLAMSTQPNGCIEDVPADGCTTVSAELNAGTGINDIATGPTGQLYVTVTPDLVTPAPNTARVLVFDPQNEGLVRRNSTAGCISQGAATNCGTGRALGTPTGVAVTGDGQDVYVAAGSGGGVLELDRSGDGGITPRADSRGCIFSGALANCTTLTTLGAPTALAISPDGHYVYATASGRISVLKRDSNSPVCQNVTVDVTHGTVPTLSLPCADEDGDALTYQIINPPTLGSLGALNSPAGTVVYAAPQGQNGTTTFTFKANYTSFATFEAIGSITVNVVGAPVLVPAGIDADKDGFFAGQDCNDANAAIRPGATEIKGNRIDENCDGTAEPFQTLPVGVSHGWDFKKHSVILTLKSLLITQQSPPGMKVKIFCKGKKCPFKSKNLKLEKAKKGARSVLKSFTAKQRKFRAGQTVEVWVSAPNFNTKVARLPLKKGKAPVAQALCVVPGQSKPQKKCD